MLVNQETEILYETLVGNGGGNLHIEIMQQLVDTKARGGYEHLPYSRKFWLVIIFVS